LNPNSISPTDRPQAAPEDGRLVFYDGVPVRHFARLPDLNERDRHAFVSFTEGF
jgi:hypothetical protein